MVQFQQDSDVRTTGDGRFVVSAPTDSIIDAPPRNKQYFDDHLLFVNNYFRKVSKGKVITLSTVVDSIITLPWPMEYYSPPRNGSNVAVANLARDTWQKVDSTGLIGDFSTFDCFVVFHAGAGRDIDLVAALGYDPTPFDIPSLYFGLNAFREYYGQTYEGIPVNGGTFHITNSIVVPETENRLVPGAGGDVLLELGMNGLLCASFGSFLGLPDLFDTNTGRSGIGRFGLMDGQSIFSFSGVFPPEPSAWEKYWLGWIDPIPVGAGQHTVSLPAASLADSVYHIPVSSLEYFLVENRNRDPLRNGQTITSTFNGIPRVQTFARDASGFKAFDISGLAGVITDVEDFDWSVPGGVDADGVLFDGGALIWHIDEGIIATTISSNGVNANRDRRGVDVEEADGSQDIGEEYGFLDPGSGSEEGTALDFWYLGNSAPVFRNTFSPNSYPNSFSNGGANSHVTIRDFTARGPRMSAVIELGDGFVSPLRGFPKLLGQQLTSPSLTVAPLTGDGAPELIVTTNGRPAVRPNRNDSSTVWTARAEIYAWKSDGTPALPVVTSNGLYAQSLTSQTSYSGPGAVQDFNNDGVPEFVVAEVHPVPAPGEIIAYSATPGSPDSIAQRFFVQAGTHTFVTPPAIGDSMIAVGAAGGRIYFLRFDGSLIDSLRWSADSEVTGISRLGTGNTFVVTFSDGRVQVTSRGTNGSVSSEDIAKSFGSQIAGPAVAGVVGPGAPARVVFTTTDGLLHVVDSRLEPVSGFPVDTRGEVLSPPALADVDGDGVRDIIVFSDTRICVYNVAGASLDYFPISIQSGNPIASAPVVADVNGDGSVEIVAVTGDGLVVAYDGTGNLATGFPLQAGIGDQSVAVFDVLSPVLNKVPIGLAVASSLDGSVSGWITGSYAVPGLAPNRPWPQYQKDAQHGGFASEPLSGSPLSSEFFPAGRAYNWPNPVYDGKTYIRYFVRENASVRVKVFDLAGDLVTEFPGPGIGGVDNEVAWEVSGVQSGIYFARIEAAGAGNSGVAVVKVAVVK
jgi:hypothetical protein